LSRTLPTIFDLFSQADVPLARSRGGLGIGLTLVRTLVELHGGKVRATSAGPGKGSEFEVRLPAGVEHPEVPPDTETHPASGAGTPRTVLVVDDNVDAATLLGEALRRRGHTVHLAHDGASALETAARVAPEIVLLDLALPDSDGHEVAARLRSELGLTESLLIAVTGYGQRHHRARSAEAGIAHHIVKPVDLARLDQILAAWEPRVGSPKAPAAGAPA